MPDILLWEGTIAKIVERGNRVTVVICTNGDRGSHNSQIRPNDQVQVRRLEQDRARKILGIKDVIWLGYRDGELATVSDLRERIIRLIRQQQPSIIISFDPWKHYEFHPDHRVVGFMTVSVCWLTCPGSARVYLGRLSTLACS
jgi:LmbE family N-acetylglucosaminyl deacetylase